jgi:hypothetical protein
VPALRCGVQSTPVIVGTPSATYANQTWVVHEQAAQYFDVAFGTSLEEKGRVICLLLFDCGLQGTPTIEAVVSGHGQQCRCKHRLRVSPAENPQSILCQFPQILERSAFGEF